jgi:outer membrane lipopolysaccharide assembly protein LptE/RlpB
MMRRFAGLMLCIVVSGCGFQLRGIDAGSTLDLPVYLKVEGLAAESKRSLRAALNTTGLNTVELSQARFVLVVGHEKLNKWPIANSFSLSSSDYEFVLELHFRLESISTGKVLVDDVVTASAHFESDRSNLLASRREEAIILAETRLAAAQRLAERIRVSVLNYREESGTQPVRETE